MTNRMTKTNNDVRVLGIHKGGEFYAFLFDDDDPRQRTQVLQTLGKWASHPELSFTWYDAAVLSGQLRKEAT